MVNIQLENICTYRGALQRVVWGGSGGGDQLLFRQTAAEHRGTLEERAEGRARASEGINTWSHAGFCSDLYETV